VEVFTKDVVLKWIKKRFIKRHKKNGLSMEYFVGDREVLYGPEATKRF